MAVKDDIAQAKKLAELDSKISEIISRIKAAITNFEQRKINLIQNKDEELKDFFKKKLDNPEIKIVLKDDEITGKYGDNLLYSLKINDKERLLKKNWVETWKLTNFDIVFLRTYQMIVGLQEEQMKI